MLTPGVMLIVFSGTSTLEFWWEIIWYVFVRVLGVGCGGGGGEGWVELPLFGNM